MARPAPPAAALPRVAGILVSGSSKRVIFAAPGGERPVIVAEGGSVNGFRVQSIEPGRVTVIGPDGPRALLPSFDPNPPPAQTAQAQAAQAGLPVPVANSIPGLPSILPPPGGPGPKGQVPGFAGLSIPGLPLAPPPVSAR